MDENTKMALGALALALLIVVSTFASRAALRSSAPPGIDVNETPSGSEVLPAVPGTPEPTPPIASQLSGSSQPCLNCHQDVMTGIIQGWQTSQHEATTTDCFACHQASPCPGQEPARQ